MIDKRESLTVMKDKSGTITDISDNLADYLRDTEDLTLTTLDYLYVGYYKPFNAMYIELDTPNINGSNITVEIWDGTAWTSPSNRDETKGMNRSGFITFDKSTFELSLIEGENLAWVRLSVDADTSAMVLKGVNIVFTDKNTIQQEFYHIDKLIDSTELIGKLVASRNEIVDRLSQRGYLKYSADLSVNDITPFDLHDVYQLKQAATFLTLAKIYLELSDSMDDHFWAKYEIYQGKFNTAINLYTVDVDLNDDGQDDETPAEKKKQAIRWSR